MQNLTPLSLACMLALFRCLSTSQKAQVTPQVLQVCCEHCLARQMQFWPTRRPLPVLSSILRSPTTSVLRNQSPFHVHPVRAAERLSHTPSWQKLLPISSNLAGLQRQRQLARVFTRHHRTTDGPMRSRSGKRNAIWRAPKPT
jgi:hypothetical protein